MAVAFFWYLRYNSFKQMHPLTMNFHLSRFFTEVQEFINRLEEKP